MIVHDHDVLYIYMYHLDTVDISTAGLLIVHALDQDLVYNNNNSY